MADFVIKGDVDLDANKAAEGIIELTTDIKKATTGMDGLSKKIEEQEKALKELDEAYVAGKISLEKYKKTSMTLSASLNENKAVMSKLSGESMNLGNMFGRFLPVNVRKGLFALKEISKIANLAGGVTSAKQFGAAIVSGLSAGVKGALQFGVALNAATGGLLLIAGAVAGIVAVISDMIQKQNEYNRRVDAAKLAHNNLKQAIKEVAAAQNDFTKGLKTSKELSDRIASTTKKLYGDIELLDKGMRDFNAAWVALNKEASEYRRTHFDLKDLAQQFPEPYARATEELNKLRDEFKRIELTQTDSKKADEQRLTLLNSQIDVLTEQAMLMHGLNTDLNDEIAALIAQRDALQKNLETVKETKTVTKELTDLSAQIENQEIEKLKTINQQDDATQSIAEKYTQQAAEAQKAYDLEVARVKKMENVSEEQRAQLLAAMAATKAEQDKLRKIQEEEETDKARANAQKEINQLTIAQLQAQGKERQALALERKEVLKQIDARKDLTAAEKEDMKTIQKTTWALKDKKKIADQMKDVVSASTDAAVSIASSAASIVGGILDAEIEKTNARLDAEIKTIDDTLKTETEIIDKWIEEENQRLDDARQRALEEAGFAVATTEEGLEAAMQAAIESGDEMIIYREEQRQKELKINQKYDKLEKEAQKKADDDKKAQQAKADAEKAKAEKEAAEKSADLQYKQAMMTWTISVAEGGVDFAKAISKAIAAGAPFASVVLASLQAAISGAALAAIIGTKPKKQMLAFAHGTIVDRPTQFKFASGSELRDGIMGEAGPEAIVPLERMDNGDLGVQASGGGQLIAVLDLFNLFVKAYNGRSLDARLEGVQ